MTTDCGKFDYLRIMDTDHCGALKYTQSSRSQPRVLTYNVSTVDEVEMKFIAYAPPIGWFKFFSPDEDEEDKGFRLVYYLI